MIDRRSSLLLDKSVMCEAQASPEMNGVATAIRRDICWIFVGHWPGSSAGAALPVIRPRFADQAGSAEASPLYRNKSMLTTRWTSTR